MRAGWCREPGRPCSSILRSARASPASSPRNAGPGLTVAQLPPIDAALVTHNHYDHLDLPTLNAVKAPVVAGIGTRASLRGLPCTELGWWDRLKLGGLEVTFVPSQHWSRRGLSDVNEALWGGFVVDGGGARVYHAGDTAYFAGFQEIGRRFPGIDAALLPIGAYDPEWFMRPQHMNPEDATQAFVDLGARALVAMHWGTFKLTDEPLDEPPARLRAEWKRRGLRSQPSGFRPSASRWRCALRSRADPRGRRGGRGPPRSLLRACASPARGGPSPSSRWFRARQRCTCWACRAPPG